MTARNLLVLLLEEGHESQLQQVLVERGDGTPSVRVVAPARVGAVEWLATDEDAARAAAETRVLQTEWALRGEVEIEGEAGESDPVLAAEDALRTFPADEILLVGAGRENGGIERSLRELGVPVTRVPAGERVRKRRPLREAMRTLARGESRTTPFVLFAGVNLVLLAATAAISVTVLLVLLALRVI
jgi:hypothetical protein